MLALSFGDVLYWSIIATMLVAGCWLFMHICMTSVYNHLFGIKKTGKRQNQSYYRG
jgi:hypothetical protein